MTTVFVGQPSTRPRAALTLERRADGQLWAVRDGTAHAVRVQRCFPWSAPARFLSLRDDEREVAFVADPAVLDTDSRRALEEALVEAGFVLQVTRVHEIEEEVEIRRWRVETVQGPRRLATRLDDWPRALPQGGYLLRDVASDLYRIPEPARLDRKSRELLWAFVD
jgi:Domain of unknown function (DUF1854)